MRWWLNAIGKLDGLYRQPPFMRPPVIPVAFTVQHDKALVAQVIKGAFDGCLAQPKRVGRLCIGQAHIAVVAAVKARVQF